ncbi:hypothetical protein FRB98_000321 [Tulasnella sp. 332]|nr:hypothetical protein FRB98_000321 [Tulasnella sp. 332]
MSEVPDQSNGLTPSFFALVLSGGLGLVATFITVVATRHPSGPQPVAYGHVQTLADPVDEWSTTMFWGDEGDGWWEGPRPAPGGLIEM